MRQPRRVGLRHHVRDHDEFAAGNGAGNAIRLGHGDGGVGADDPQRLDPAILDRAEHVHGLETGLFRHAGRVPEVLDGGAMGGALDFQMAGQHIGKAAHLAPAHGIGLAGDAEGSHARPPDPAGGQMAVQDRIHLVRAAVGLVDALRIDRDHLVTAQPEVEKLRKLGRCQPGLRRVRGVGSSQGRLDTVYIFVIIK